MRHQPPAPSRGEFLAAYAFVARLAYGEALEREIRGRRHVALLVEDESRQTIEDQSFLLR